MTDYEILHRRLGHINDNALRKTAKAVIGIKEPGQKPLTLCEPCCLSKAKRLPVPGTSKKELDILEVIQFDTQGPFPIEAIDGTRNNVKFIDSKSGYCKMETIQDRKASTILAAFKRFQSKLERRTGKKIKFI